MGVSWWNLFGVARRVAQMHREFEQELLNRRGIRLHKKPTGPPATFAVYRDTKGRFELRYPAEWERGEGKDFFHVSSPRLGTVARVDVMPETPDLWGAILKLAHTEGARASLRVAHPGRTEHATGEITLGEVRFQWDLYAHRLPGAVAVLSTYNVIDSRRSVAIEGYEDRVLEVIVENFKAPAVAPS